jgi:antitoxin component YwqK of YwqJK toxin-antitoxin module
MKHILHLVWLGLLLVVGLAGCKPNAYNSDYNLSRAALKQSAKADAIALADTTKPSTETGEALEEVEEKQEKKRKKKADKRYFMGDRVARGFVKSGGRGDREVVETFSYLVEHKDPDPYAPEKFYYDSKDRKLYKTRNEVNPDRHKVLHGAYKKELGGEVVEEGYFYAGTKHLRWERYNRNGILLSKEHFEKGFLRDAVVTYYEGTKKIKEVIPYAYGEVQGTYYRFYENGQLEWSGQYQKGRKVGVWVKHYDFRARRQYEYQYPKTPYEPKAEPYLVKQYDRHGTLIFEKDKLDKRASAR